MTGPVPSLSAECLVHDPVPVRAGVRLYRSFYWCIKVTSAGPLWLREVKEK